MTAPFANLTGALRRFVDDGSLAGVAALVWQGGECVYREALGYRDLAAGAPMTMDAIFRIASMTKPVTAALAMMLVDDGQIALDDPISRWIPELAAPRVLRSRTGALDDTMPAAREITVCDLLTHRAGIAYSFSESGPIADAYEIELGPAVGNPLSPDEWLRRLGTLPLVTQPGEQMVYGHSSDVLGFLIGRVESKSLGAVLEQRLLVPLAMRDTAFWCAPERHDRLARMYRHAESGVLEDVTAAPRTSPPAFESGGGGLYSTADDYLRFARMLLGSGEADGRRSLRAETTARLRSNVLSDAQRRLPFAGIPGFWAAQGYGLGVSMILDPERIAPLGVGGRGAFGWGGAYGTWWQADPSCDLIAIFMIQDWISLGPAALARAWQGAPVVPRARLALPVFQSHVYEALRSGGVQR